MGLKKSKLRQTAMVKWYHPYGFILPAFAVIFLIIILPIIFSFMISIYDIKISNLKFIRKIGINIFALPVVYSKFFIGIKNFIALIQDPVFAATVLRTFIWTFVNVFFHVVIGVWLAVILNRKLPGKSIFKALFIIPWAIPQYSAANTWKSLFDNQYGAINIIARNIGLQQVNWLGNPDMTFIAAIITNIWLGFPFMMMVALGALQSIPSDLYEAADIDGANGLQKFKNITLPLINPIMTPSIILGFVWTFNMINIIYIFADNGRPAPETQILVTKMYTDGLNLYRYSYAAAIGVAIFIILIAFAYSYIKISTRKAEHQL